MTEPRSSRTDKQTHLSAEAINCGVPMGGARSQKTWTRQEVARVVSLKSLSIKVLHNVRLSFMQVRRLSGAHSDRPDAPVADKRLVFMDAGVSRLMSQKPGRGDDG